MKLNIPNSVKGACEFGRFLTDPEMIAAMGRSTLGMLTHRRSRSSDLPPASKESNQKTAIFVNGVASHPAYLGLVARHLEADCTTVLPDYQSVLSSFGSIRAQATSLVRFLDEYVNQTGAEAIHLVGHSNGGSVSLEALGLLEERNRPLFERIKSVVTISSPIFPPSDRLKYHLPHTPILKAIPAAQHLLSDDFFHSISRYYDKISLSLVAKRDRLIPPEMQSAPGRPQREIDMSHNWRARHEREIADHIRTAICSPDCFSP